MCFGYAQCILVQQGTFRYLLDAYSHQEYVHTVSTASQSRVHACTVLSSLLTVRHASGSTRPPALHCVDAQLLLLAEAHMLVGVLASHRIVMLSCRHAGKSRVDFVQKHYLFLHAWKRDFFHTAIHTKLYYVFLMMAVIYTISFFFFGLLWYWIIK